MNFLVADLQDLTNKLIVRTLSRTLKLKLLDSLRSLEEYLMIIDLFWLRGFVIGGIL